MQVLVPENNSQDLFTRWRNETDADYVECGKDRCTINTSNAYIVRKNFLSKKKYIIPLCDECYNQEANSGNHLSEDIIDTGSIIIVDENLVRKYYEPLANSQESS
jgi:hypothetical protein